MSELGSGPKMGHKQHCSNRMAATNWCAEVVCGEATSPDPGRRDSRLWGRIELLGYFALGPVQ